MGILCRVVIGTILLTQAYAAESVDDRQQIKPACVKAWMSRIDTITEKIEYQNYGEKYCTCLAEKAPDTTASALANTTKNCLSRILLHNAMDVFEDDVGLKDITLGDIAEYCHDKWSLFYPNQDSAMQQSTANYCACVKPKLLALAKKADTMTDEIYNGHIDNIADNCAIKLW